MSPSQDHFSRIPSNFVDNGELLAAIDNFAVDPRCVAEFAYSGMYVGSSGDICICGHPVGVHTNYGCRLTSKRACACKKTQVVAAAGDVRHFFSVTTGTEEQHAFGKGMNHSVESGDWVVFEPPRCKCGELAQSFPVALDKRHGIQYSPSEKNIFLCKRCINRRLFPVRAAKERAAALLAESEGPEANAH